MHARHVALMLGAALVAIGGIYLFLEVRGAGVTPPPAQALEEARLRHARSSGGGAAASPDRPARAPELDRADDVFAKGAGGKPARPDPSASAPEPLEPDVPPHLRGDRFRRSDDPPRTEDPLANPDVDAALLEANKAYDRKDFEGARALALKLLDQRAPGNVRMLRVVVSSSCILGEADTARKYYGELPELDRTQMTARCAQYGVTIP